MSSGSHRQQLLLSTAVFFGALSGYGSRAYAACTNTGSTWVCQNASSAQTINNSDAPNNDDATVSTLSGFSVSTTSLNTNAITITGDGALSYTDTNNSSLSATRGNGLEVEATGNTSNPGGVSINTNGDVDAKNRGIYAHTKNSATGSITINVNGDAEITNLNFATIHAFSESTSSADVTVTVGSSVNVHGEGDATHGVHARNFGQGDTTVNVYGYVKGNDGYGIEIANGNSSGTQGGRNLTVVTGATSTVIGSQSGINAFNNSTSGLTAITVGGDVTGNAKQGIYARNQQSTSTDLKISATAGSNVEGSESGITAYNNGSGVTEIIVDGGVTGNGDNGIFAQSANKSIAITVGSTGTVTSKGAQAGDFAVKSQGGPATLAVSGKLEGGNGGAVQFDTGTYDDRLELHPGFDITTSTAAGAKNIVFAGGGTNDTLAFSGPGSDTFDLDNIGDTTTQQYREFERFQVEAGTWSFSGTTAAPFTQTGGTMMGTGTFGGLDVQGGTLAPGNSIGSMTVNGNFTLGPGAVFQVELDATPNNSDKVFVVGGTVNITGATLQVLAQNGAYNPSTDYVIIDNDGNDAVNGTFGSVSTNFAFLTPIVAYDGGDGNDVVLTLLRTVVPPDSGGGSSGGGSGGEPNYLSFCSVAQTRNQCNVAEALDKFPFANSLFLSVLTQTVDGARQAFDALSGEVHATVAGTVVDDSRYVREAVLGRMMQASHRGGSLAASGPQMATYESQPMMLGGTDSLYDGKHLLEAPGPQPLAFWTRAFGAWGDFDGNGNAASANRDLGGFVSGMDAAVSDSWRVGLATGASFSNVSVDERYSGADVESFHLGGYVGGMAGPVALRGGGMWTWNEIDTSRAVVFPRFYERQKANYDADTGQLFGEIAYPTQFGSISVEPFGGLAYVSVQTDAFKERGGPQASLRGVNLDQDVGYTTVGLRAAKTMMWGATQITPHISAAWLHAFDDVTPGASLAFATTGIGFDVTGVPLAEDSALLDAGLDFAVTDRISAGVSYSGQFADNVSDNAVKGRFTWLFN